MYPVLISGTTSIDTGRPVLMECKNKLLTEVREVLKCFNYQYGDIIKMGPHCKIPVLILGVWNQNWHPHIERRGSLRAPPSILGPLVPVLMLGCPLSILGHFQYGVQHIRSAKRRSSKPAI